MKDNEAKLDPKTKKGTYTRKVHHGESVLGTKILNTGPSELGQNLAGQKGMEGAKKLMLDLYESKK